MNLFLIGQGNVGTALSSFFQVSGITCEILGKVPENKNGILFLAVSDSAVKPLLEETLRKNPEMFAVHFSAATHFENKRVFLLHPYSSINKKSELNQVLFTLWGKKDTVFEEMLKKKPDLKLDEVSGITDGTRCPDVPVECRCEPKADGKYPCVMAASILAKTARDRLMLEMDKKYPGYGYAGHKGYPTKAHREICHKLGPSPIQRMTFKY